MKTDLTYLKSMAGENVELIREMISIFNEQVIEFKEVMSECLEKKDWLALSKIAHKAKSSVAIMGMTEMSNEMRILELNANEGKQPELYYDSVAHFLKECELALEELNKI